LANPANIMGPTSALKCLALLATLAFAAAASSPLDADSEQVIKALEGGDKYENIYNKKFDTPETICSLDPMTGYERTGQCRLRDDDPGTHVVCAQMTMEFLLFSKGKGNDLIDPVGNWFPGLKGGDRWCLCVLRWHQAWSAGHAPPVVPEATSSKALIFSDITVDLLEECSTKNFDWSTLKFKVNEKTGRKFCEGPQGKSKDQQ